MKHTIYQKAWGKVASAETFGKLHCNAAVCRGATRLNSQPVAQIIEHLLAVSHGT
jgi:hypothetical protein